MKSMNSTRCISGGKYWQVKTDKQHPSANNQGWVLEHIIIAEKALGKHLPKGAVVHHVNGNGLDNRKENLVICQDQAYHILLHQRTRAREATGNPNALKCKFCKVYFLPNDEDVRIYNQAEGKGKGSYSHGACARKYINERRAKYGRTS